MRTAGRLVRLVERYSLARVEAACARALRFGDPSYTTVKRILHLGLDQAIAETAIPPVIAPADFAFARNAEELFGATLGGATWN